MAEPTRKTTIECIKCGKTFANLEDYRRHIEEKKCGEKS